MHRPSVLCVWVAVEAREGFARRPQRRGRSSSDGTVFRTVPDSPDSRSDSNRTEELPLILSPAPAPLDHCTFMARQS